jgi:hypothetical protein
VARTVALVRQAPALLAVLLSSCAAPPWVAPSLPAALEGVWCNSTDGGKSCWAWDEFTPEGTLKMCGLQDEDDRPFRAVATVAFEGRRMCYRVVAASENFWLRPGQRYCTEIVRVDPDSHVYRDLDTAKEFMLRREPAVERSCLPQAEHPRSTQVDPR